MGSRRRVAGHPHNLAQLFADDAFHRLDDEPALPIESALRRSAGRVGEAPRRGTDAAVVCYFSHAQAERAG